MRGRGPVADLMRQRFAIATKRLGMDARWDGLYLDRFAVPPKTGDQLALF
jgi:hypothetical protein